MFNWTHTVSQSVGQVGNTNTSKGIIYCQTFHQATDTYTPLCTDTYILTRCTSSKALDYHSIANNIQKSLRLVLMPKLQIFLPRECCTMETKATDLAGEAVREEYVSGGQVSVDKVLPG